MSAWVRHKDKSKQLDIFPYQKAPTPPMSDALHQACAKSVHVVTPEGTILNRGRAVIFIFNKIGYSWTKIGLIPPLIYFANLIYWIVSKNRPFFARFLFTRETYESDE